MSEPQHQPTKKNDLQHMKKSIVDEISEVIKGTMTVLSSEHQKIEGRLDNLEFGQGRIERKVNALYERGDEHDARLRKLEKKIA